MKPSHAANDNLIDRTRKVWQPRTGCDLTDEDARQIAEPNRSADERPHRPAALVDRDPGKW